MAAGYHAVGVCRSGLDRPGLRLANPTSAESGAPTSRSLPLLELAFEVLDAFEEVEDQPEGRVADAQVLADAQRAPTSAFETLGCTRMSRSLPRATAEPSDR